MQLTLNIVEFGLIAFLGFMPLIVIHWADRRPTLDLHHHLPRLDARKMALAAKTSLLLILTDWSSKIIL